MPREPHRPNLDGLSDVEAIETLGNYAERLVAYNSRMIDAVIDRSESTTDRPKTLTNTARDKELARAKTIHDVIAKKPQFLKELEAIFGKRVL